jgi:tRNA-dihydrouridine synthase B
MAGPCKLGGRFFIGGVGVLNRALLAPMSGMVKAPFRQLVGWLGPGPAASEMTVSEPLVVGGCNAKLRVQRQAHGVPVVQLVGCEDAGAAIIDISMGCPTKHVANGRSRSALMRDVDHAQRLIEATVRSVMAVLTCESPSAARVKLVQAYDVFARGVVA